MVYGRWYTVGGWNTTSPGDEGQHNAPEKNYHPGWYTVGGWYTTSPGDKGQHGAP